MRVIIVSAAGPVRQAVAVSLRGWLTTQIAASAALYAKPNIGLSELFYENILPKDSYSTEDAYRH